MLALLLLFEERASMTWFTWSEARDLSNVPHPGTFVSRAAVERLHEGIVRIGVPASVVTLRWHDYVKRNGEESFALEV